MNPQPEQSTVNIVTILFVGLVFFFAITTKKRFTLSDKIDILHEVNENYSFIQNIPIDQKPKRSSKPKQTSKPKLVPKKAVNPIVNNTTTTTTTTTTTVPPKPKLSKNNFMDIHNECKEALINLGMKRTEATNTVINIFNKYDITSIEDFIKKAFAPNEYS